MSEHWLASYLTNTWPRSVDRLIAWCKIIMTCTQIHYITIWLCQKWMYLGNTFGLRVAFQNNFRYQILRPPPPNTNPPNNATPPTNMKFHDPPLLNFLKNFQPPPIRRGGAHHGTFIHLLCCLIKITLLEDTNFYPCSPP